MNKPAVLDHYTDVLREAREAAEAAEDAGTQQLINALERLSAPQRAEELRRCLLDMFGRHR